MKKILYLFLVISISCQRSSTLEPGSTFVTTSEASEYKGWFDEKMKTYSGSSNLKLKIISNEFTPSWSEAMWKEDKDIQTLSVPLKLESLSEIKGTVTERFAIFEKDNKTKKITVNIIITNSDRSLQPNERLTLLNDYRNNRVPNIIDRISLYDIEYSLKEYTDYENSKVLKKSVITANPYAKTKSPRLASNCTDWYTVVYVDGVVNSITYSHTECRCEQTIVSTPEARGGCEGGTGSTTPAIGYINALPPGAKAMAVFADPCAFAQDMVNRMNSTVPPIEYYGVMTTDGRYLVTQKLDQFGGVVAGMYRNPTSGQGLYVWPVDQQVGVPSYQGATIISAEGVPCWAIPISAVIHSHPSGTTNNVTPQDAHFSASLPTTRFYIINNNLDVALFTEHSTTYSYPNPCSTLR